MLVHGMLRGKLHCIKVFKFKTMFYEIRQPPLAVLQGYLTYNKTHPPWDPTVGLCLGSQGGPRGMAVLSWAR